MCGGRYRGIGLGWRLSLWRRGCGSRERQGRWCDGLGDRRGLLTARRGPGIKTVQRLGEREGRGDLVVQRVLIKLRGLQSSQSRSS